MSPKNMPVRIKPIPPIRNSRRAPKAANPASSASLLEETLVNAWDPDTGVALRQPLFFLYILLPSATLLSGLSI
jgi:hypothetical protein